MNDQLFDLRNYIAPDVINAYKAAQPTALQWWSNPRYETSRLGLDQTTARAISTGIRGKHGPIAIYETWATLQLVRVTSDSALQASLATREGFEGWHADLSKSLVTHWHTLVAENSDRLRLDEGEDFVPANHELSIAHRYKMVDLFVKYLRVKAETYPELAKCCYEFGHIPLDRKSLAVISAAFSGIGMSQDFSMGDVASETIYQTAQRLALAICAEAGGTPLLLDVFAWHTPYAQRLYAKPVKSPSRKSVTRRKNKTRTNLE